MSAVQIQLPPKLVPVFANPYRYRGAYGGRGSAKTRSFATMAAVRGMQLAEAGERGLIVCGREYQNSLDDSSFAEVKAVIQSIPWLNAYYECGDRFVRTRNRRISFTFAGLHHQLGSIRSKAKIWLAWIDEAEDVSEAAWRILIPTVREEGSEIWATWNPGSEASATHQRLRKAPPANSAIVEMNWRDNPWFPSTLNQERISDLHHRPETYDHVWEGCFFEVTDAQIFKGRVRVHDFEIDDSYGSPLHGLDFGFSRDPTAAVRLYIRDNVLFVRNEAVKQGLELDHTAQYVMLAIPRIEQYDIRADCSRPESISFLQRNGLPRIIACDKWSGSVEDGIEFMKSFDEIIVHPSCTHCINEFRLYSYKIDRMTEEVQPKIVDANNHCIDAIRYALGNLIKSKQASAISVMGIF